MAEYWLNIDSYSVGQTPSEFVNENDVSSIEVLEDATEGKFVRFQSPEGTRSAASFTPAGTSDNVEIFCILRVNDENSGGFFAGGDNLSNQSEITAGTFQTRFFTGAQRDEMHRITAYLDGNFASDTIPNKVDPGDVHNALGTYDGTEFQGTFWPLGESQPTSVDVTSTDTNGVVGKVGVFMFDYDVDIFAFGVGTDGDAAPRSALTTSGEITGTASDVDGNLLDSGTMYAFRADGSSTTVVSTAIQSGGTFTFTGLTSGEDYIITGQSIVDTTNVLPQGRIMTAS